MDLFTRKLRKKLKKYPVLYMHDGQNVFDEYTSGFGEWGVDECLDSLINSGTAPCIVVAIDNGSKRLNEYNPFDNTQFGKGEGDDYVAFLVKTLKPYIDKNYRTLAGKENTIIAGSSMGGLISYYAALTHPEVFGKAGIFSPAFWIAPQLTELTDSLSSKLNGKFYFTIGSNEGQQYVFDMENIAEKLASNSNTMIYSKVAVNENHNEKNWRNQFAEFYKWIMADGYNYVIKIEED
ncbi:MAG: alpha/beta hydrolase [Chitinophagaceae bacterium]|nr:alpha/beta hydrolase [Chitinophagaceae bacterium]